MARLSQEHFRANASMSTPKSARTSSRLRDIFKPRRSESSVSPKTPTKSPSTAVEDVFTPQGEFEFHHPHAKEMTSVLDGDAKPSIDPKGHVSGEVEDVSGDPSRVQTADVVMMTETTADMQTVSMVETESVGAQFASSPAHGDVYANQDARSHQKSFASNIFDDKDSLSAGIREYVESKIAEVFHKHSCDCPVRAPLNITAKFEVDNSGDVSRSTPFRKIPGDTNILVGRKTFGPFIINNERPVRDAQFGVIAIYLLLLFASALVGPKTFLLTVWRIGIILLTYIISCRLCNWKIKADSDLLLAPTVPVVVLLQKLCHDILDSYGIFRVRVASQVVRDMNTEVGLVFQPAN